MEKAPSSTTTVVGRTSVVARLKGAAGWIAKHELWLLVIAVPVLILSYRFPQVATPFNRSPLSPASLALLSLLLPRVCRWVAEGRLTIRTYLDLPLLGLLAMIPVSLYASADFSLSLPILHKMIAEVAIFYGVVNSVCSLKQVRRLAALILGISAGLSLLCLLGTNWPASKIFSLPQVYEHLPRVIIPQLNVAGFSRNIAGGVLAMLLPITLSFLLFGSKRILKPILGMSVAIMAFTLLLTQSRGAWIGLAISLLVMGIWRNRWLLLGIPASAAIVFITVQHFGIQSVADFMLITESAPSAASRFEIWQRAIYMIQDFPYTGIGLGTFSRVGPLMYPYFLAGPDADIPHAHNIFLQAGVDLGIPGLVAFIGVLVAFVFTAWETLRLSRDSDLEPLALGLLCGFIVYLIHGLLDSITAVSIKAGIALWALMGFTTALWANLKAATPTSRT